MSAKDTDSVSTNGLSKYWKVRLKNLNPTYSWKAAASFGVSATTLTKTLF